MTTTTQTIATARVLRGARRLDDMVPFWDRDIDGESLTMDRIDLCVIGQIATALHSTFDGAAAVIADAMMSSEAQERFLIANGFETERGTDEEFDALTMAWRNVIAARACA